MSSGTAAPSALLSAIRQQSTALNLRPLQRIDPLIHSVVFTGKHTVLYRLERDSEQWERDNVEGPFFIVERVAAPVYQLVILNRLGLDQWMLPVHTDTRFELQEEHYLFIQSGPDVVGVWFYEPTDAQLAAIKLQQLTLALANRDTPTRLHNTADIDSTANTSAASTTHTAIVGVPLQQSHPTLIASGRRLHSQPPPPALLPLSEAMDGASEAELHNRLNTFLGAFNQSDERHSHAHREALLSQHNQLTQLSQLSDSGRPEKVTATTTTLLSTGSTQPHKGVPLPLHALFHSAAAAYSNRPSTPSTINGTTALTAAELEKSLAAQRTANIQPASNTAPSVQLHPLVSQLFQHSADTAQQQQHSPLHHSASLQARPAVPSSLSSPALLFHNHQPAARTQPSHTPLLPPTSLHLTFPPLLLPAALTRTAFTIYLHDLLADERIAAELYSQYTRQHSSQHQPHAAERV